MKTIDNPYADKITGKPLDGMKKKCKNRVGYLMRKYPERVRILYECSCRIYHPYGNGNKKHRHHPNYSDPFDVCLLCAKCHMREHSRIEPGYSSR